MAATRGEPLVILVILIASLSPGLGQWEDEVDVETDYGTVIGHTIELIDEYHSGISINSFLGIPYARPPVGDLRFALAQKPDPYVNGTFVADTLGTACLQSPLGTITLTHPLWNDFDEDCLNMNIFTPSPIEDGPYPVMVFFHGGAYQSSANIQYLGHFLAARGVVVVVPNYRLGVFGFAYTADENIPGNMGLRDQNMVLEYVRDNIANFGGDSSAVTIFGQSAGAGSCGLHLMSPMSSGLFHQAILQSGSELAMWAYNGPAQMPETYIESVAEQLDCPTDDTAAMTECLREVPARELRLTDFNCTEGTFCLGFAPVIDGEGGFVPDIPLELRDREEFNMVPEMIGILQEDAFLYLLPLGPPTLQEGLNRTEFENLIELFANWFAPMFPDPERAGYVEQALNWFYTPWPHIHDKDKNLYQIGMLMTDAAFGVTADLQMKHHSQYAPTYSYVFEYLSANATIVPDWAGTPHMLELPYVFGYPFIRHNPLVREDSQIIDVIGYDDADDAYSDFMMTVFTNFAKYGNPTPEPVTPPREEFEPAEWPKFTTEDLYSFYIGNTTFENILDYRQLEYAFFFDHLDYLVNGMAGIIDPVDRSTSSQFCQELAKKGGDCEELLVTALKNRADIGWAAEYLVDEIFY